jgi:hypothetical protein
MKWEDRGSYQDSAWVREQRPRKFGTKSTSADIVPGSGFPCDPCDRWQSTRNSLLQSSPAAGCQAAYTCRKGWESSCRFWHQKCQRRSPHSYRLFPCDGRKYQNREYTGESKDGKRATSHRYCNQRSRRAISVERDCPGPSW